MNNDKCEYCGTEHVPQQCPAYEKKCGECDTANHFKVICRLSWRQLENWQTKKMVDKMHQKDKTILTNEKSMTNVLMY